MTTKVLDPLQTLDRILEGYSISRFRSTEINLSRAIPSSCHDADETLQRRLIDVLRAKHSGFIVGVPMFTPEHFARLSDKKRGGAEKHRRQLLGMWEPANEYGSSFISRPDFLPMDDFSQLYEKWERLWTGREIAILRNEKWQFELRTSAGKLAKSCEIVLCPQTQAWKEYDRLMDKMRRFSKDTLILLSAGPVATLMAYDLHKDGYQTVDCGSLGVVWKRADGMRTS